MKKKQKPNQRSRDEKDQGAGATTRSEFPKDTLDKALRVARTIEESNGGQPLPPTDTAIALGISPGSSDFRVLLSSSNRYGLTRGSYKSDRITIETLGLNIVRPTSLEQKSTALVEAALKQETFRAMYNYYRGKKLPEANFFQNTVVREFGIPVSQAQKCVDVFLSNMEFVGLVRTASTGKWLSGDLAPNATESSPDEYETSNGTQDQEHEPLGTRPNLDQLQTLPVDGDKKPNVPKAIFLGHGKNKEPLGQVKAILDQYKIPYVVAVDEPNEFRPISQKVADSMKACGAAILVFTADEEFLDPEGKKVWRPSENVVYELGAASVLYGKRIVVFKEVGVHFPANFRDIGFIEFERGALSSKTNELFRELIAFGLIKVTVGSGES